MQAGRWLQNLSSPYPLHARRTQKKLETDQINQTERCLGVDTFSKLQPSRALEFRSDVSTMKFNGRLCCYEYVQKLCRNMLYKCIPMISRYSHHLENDNMCLPSVSSNSYEVWMDGEDLCSQEKKMYFLSKSQKFFFGKKFLRQKHLSAPSGFHKVVGGLDGRRGKWLFTSWIHFVQIYCTQGCISCGILVSGIRARGVSSEHMENMEMFSCSPTQACSDSQRT